MSYHMDSPLSHDQVSRLLDELCVRLGFCLPPADTVRIQQEPPLDARDFANAVFLAEGMDPEASDLHLWRQVRDVIQVHFARAEANP